MRRPPSPTARRLVAGLAVAVAALPLASCKEVETAASTSYQPAKVEPVKGAGDDVKRVTFTADGARRVGLQTAVVEKTGGRLIVPYAALIYDEDGAPFVYTVPKPLTFLRAPVKIARLENGRVVMSAAPPAGTKVVTVGAAEVYGAELEIAGSH